MYSFKCMYFISIILLLYYFITINIELFVLSIVLLLYSIIYTSVFYRKLVLIWQVTIKMVSSIL